MKNCFLALCFLGLFFKTDAQCIPPRIIEFGEIDEPCVIGVLCEPDSCELWWSCDGNPPTLGNQRIAITMFGTHHYQVVAKNACGTDSAICIASDRGCEWAATGISEIFEDDRVVSKCILDISGRIVSVNSKLPLGTYEEICITARGTVRIKRIVIFK